MFGLSLGLRLICRLGIVFGPGFVLEIEVWDLVGIGIGAEVGVQCQFRVRVRVWLRMSVRRRARVTVGFWIGVEVGAGFRYSVQVVNRAMVGPAVEIWVWKQVGVAWVRVKC